MQSLKGKYIPVSNLKKYEANFTTKEKVDPTTGQVIRKARNLLFSYVLIQDAYNNVYMVPVNEDGRQYYGLTDIVEAASGNEKSIEKIENARLDVKRKYGADLCGELWQSRLYNGGVDGGILTIKADFEIDCNQDCAKTKKAPDVISTYKTLAEKSQQISGLLKTARNLEKI